VEEWEAQEQELRAHWIAEYPDGSDDNGDEWLNRQLILWQAERREVLQEEAQARWKQREPEYEKRWEAYLRENIGESLRSER
jgi:hypothetical protein